MWMNQAESDLKKAENDVKTSDFDSAAFWSHQAAEKSLKALLVHYGKAYRGHDLVDMGKILRTDFNLDITTIEKELRELTMHYTVSRYPDAANSLPYELYDREKAVELVERARRVVEWARQRLR